MFEFKTFRRTLPSMNDLRLRLISRTIGWDNGRPAGGEVEPRHAMILWLANCLMVADLDSDKVELICQVFGKPIKSYGTKIQEAVTAAAKEFPAARLMIADHRFAAVTGDEDHFLDLATGAEVQKLPKSPTQVTMYDLGVIYTSKLEAMRRFETNKLQPPRELEDTEI